MRKKINAEIAQHNEIVLTLSGRAICFAGASCRGNLGEHLRTMTELWIMTELCDLTLQIIQFLKLFWKFPII